MRDEMTRTVTEVLVATVQNNSGLTDFSTKMAPTLGHNRTVDAVVTYSGIEAQLKIALQVFPNKNDRFFMPFLEEVAFNILAFPDYCFVVATRSISKSQVALCKLIGVGLIDLGGNCQLHLGSIHISIAGQDNPYKLGKQGISLTSVKSQKVVAVMASQPERLWRVKDLATVAKVSLGLVSYVRQALRREGRLFEVGQGFRLSDSQHVVIHQLQ